MRRQTVSTSASSGMAHTLLDGLSEGGARVHVMAPPQLRAYQREAIAAVIAARRSGVRRMVVCLPTGAGKTVIFSHLARLATKQQSQRSRQPMTKAGRVRHQSTRCEFLAPWLSLVFGWLTLYMAP